MAVLRVAVAQTPNLVGDLDGNAERIADAMAWAEHEAAADVLVLPELALTGYGLGDLVLHREFVRDAEEALLDLARRSGRLTTVVSTVDPVAPQRSWDTRERSVALCAALLCDGEVRGRYHKCLLPGYDLFEEARNFAPGREPDKLWRIGDVICGVAICEDLWSPDGPPEAQAGGGAQVLLVPNASPFHRGKAEGRLANTQAVARRNGVPIVYVNCSGAHDELVFDGGSIVVDAQGELLHRGLEFAEDRFYVDVPVAAPRRERTRPVTVHTRPLLRDHGEVPPPPRTPGSDVDSAWLALVAALRHWVERNDFQGVCLGLSGGIDSALVAHIAAAAVGPERVLALVMPSPDTPEEETDDALALAQALGIEVQRHLVGAWVEDWDDPSRRARRFARERAALLLDVFDERRYLVLAPGNKTEISIGETELFGDLTGFYAPLRDCPKRLVYELARMRAALGAPMLESIIDRPSTAQQDADGVVPYAVLDDLVWRYVELGEGMVEMVAAGHDPQVVEDVLRRIDAAEVVRRFTPPGVKITSRAFDQDRRMPIANDWRAHRHTRVIGVATRPAPVATAPE